MRLKDLVVCLGVAALAACASQHPSTPAAPPLRVAVPRNSPPYAFRQKGGLVGLEVDFARELAAALGRPLDLVETDFGNIIPALQARRADVAMAGLTITRARQVLIAFSEPYLRSGLLAVMRREDVPRFTSVSSVLRTTQPIGVVTGTTAERFVREHAPSASVAVYPTAPAAMDELRQRRVTFVGRRDAALRRERGARALAHGRHTGAHPGTLGAVLAAARGGHGPSVRPGPP